MIKTLLGMRYTQSELVLRSCFQSVLAWMYTSNPLKSVISCNYIAVVITLMKLTISALFFPIGDRIRQTENRATRCKVERLQLLMQQKRLRRKARRDQRSPYQWLPNRRSGRSNSNSSMSSEGSLDLDFDDSVWKHDVKADLNSEYVMA